jgi:hypothetical protein
MGLGTADMEMMIWNIILTGIVAMLGYLMKEKFAELTRLGVLLNKTREEVARDHITRAEFRQDMRELLERLDALSVKIDALRDRKLS